MYAAPRRLGFYFLETIVVEKLRFRVAGDYPERRRKIKIHGSRGSCQCRSPFAPFKEPTVALCPAPHGAPAGGASFVIEVPLHCVRYSLEGGGGGIHYFSRVESSGV